MTKKIKKSKRGLTFSMNKTDSFQIGARYNYIVKDNNIIINLCEAGSLKVSKKKSGKSLNPLFDIRSKEVKKIVSEANYLQIEVQDEKIIVYTCKEVKKSAFQLLKKKKHDIEQILSINKKVTGEIIIPRELLKASGSNVSSDYFTQITLDNWISGFSVVQDAKAITQIKKEIKTVFDVISLFSGGGMLDYPFHKDNSFNLVYAIDYEKAAVETYQANIGNHIEHKNILDVVTSEIPDGAVIIGGPSCKAFSNSNRNTRLKEHQDVDLVDEYIRIVTEKTPDIFVIENVPEFLTACDGEYLNRVLDNLSDYEVSYQVVKDSDLGGFTKRKRVIIIGSKIGKIEIPNIKLLPYKKVKEALDKVDVTWFNYEDYTKSRPDTEKAMSYVQPGHNFKDIPKEFFNWTEKTHSIRYRRLSNDESECPALPNWRKAIIMPPEGNRILSVAEAASLMGFDKNFKVLGTLNERQQIIGNGVPYSIGSTIKNILKKALNNHYSRLEMTF